MTQFWHTDSTFRQMALTYANEVEAVPCLQKPSSPTPPNTQTTMKQPTLPAQKTSTASTHPQWTRKIPLLPTPSAPVRQFSEMPTFPRPVLHNRQFTSRPSPFITRPSPIYNRFHQQQIPLPPPSHQIPAFPGPHQQTPGHYTQQVSLPPYVPIVILTPYNQINSI